MSEARGCETGSRCGTVKRLHNPYSFQRHLRIRAFEKHLVELAEISMDSFVKLVTVLHAFCVLNGEITHENSLISSVALGNSRHGSQRHFRNMDLSEARGCETVNRLECRGKQGVTGVLFLCFHTFVIVTPPRFTENRGLVRIQYTAMGVEISDGGGVRKKGVV